MPETTIMRDSQVGDEWIAEMCRLNPVQRVISAETGQPNGSLLSGPVRLQFTDSIFEAKPQMRSDVNSKLKHSTVCLFTPFSDMTLFWEEYWRIASTDFASHYDHASSQYYGLDPAINDQGTKMKHGGFTPGLPYISVSSKFKPAVVDARMNPIVDQSKVYPGVWAIVAVNSYASGKQAPRKGPRFGLQTIMIVGDDKQLSGGAPDPRQQFAGVNVRAPMAAPSAAFGQAPQMGGVPPQQGVGAVYGAQGGSPAMHPGGGYAPMQQPQQGYQQPPGDDEDLSQFA